MLRLAAGAGPQRLAVTVLPDAEAASEACAALIADAIRAAVAARGRCVLALPTGSTPKRVYARLVELHRRGGLSFRDVHVFALDEYHGLAEDHPQAFARFLRQHLVGQVDLPADRFHAPRGDLAPEAVAAHASEYEAAIAAAGGLDLAVLGIGRNGHIAFNEPGSPRGSRTRLAWLDAATRHDAVTAFGGEARVPRRGVSMGVATILGARRVVLLALGEGKAPALAAAVDAPADAACPASWLQEHPAAEVIADAGAATRLAAVRAPWLAGTVAWDGRLARRAVIGLARALQKPILALTERDYHDHRLHDLLAARGPAGALNVAVFRELQATITGWPGGKPPHRRQPGDIERPRDAVHPKRVLVLSPHPDDDVIAVGGTIARLAEHGHEVWIAYQTSGANAVWDDDLDRHLAFVAGAAPLLGQGAPGAPGAAARRQLKGLVRRTEAAAAAAVVGVPAERLVFQDLALYERRALGEDDVAATIDLIARLRPHQIYAAGDLADPHGTHRLCLEAATTALRRLAAEPWLTECEVRLYRGAWQEWDLDEIDIAVPLAPDDVLRKRSAILRHQSQTGRIPFPGEDAREFWQRAEDRMRTTAAAYDAIGLAQYVAIEAFARWRP